MLGELHKKKLLAYTVLTLIALLVGYYAFVLIVTNNIDFISYITYNVLYVAVGMLARSCKDFINQQDNIINLYDARFIIYKDYERIISDNELRQYRKDDYIMTYVESFKMQAKNLFKDGKTRTTYTDVDGSMCYQYNGKHFEDIYDENDFTLMKAQYIIACMAGFLKWA